MRGGRILAKRALKKCHFSVKITMLRMRGCLGGIHYEQAA